MEINDLSLRKLATVLGVSQPFLSQIRAGKRPMPEGLKKKVEALGAYHLLITGGEVENHTEDRDASQTLNLGTIPAEAMVGVGRIELPASCSQSRRPTAGLHPDCLLILT